MINTLRIIGIICLVTLTATVAYTGKVIRDIADELSDNESTKEDD